ncbi:DUF2798 domain-containing protein [Tropicibacter sp. Alg240-R139]|uniref:DUF2798 domain-containing protein n=1 Tax=Tropicibacter sp. Alg240-R139 TaxID=2305991 RepID=UPI0013E0D30E|nr:DUF2798 domain-containing protein [Tropicibacter sp. Alg240-R139]
MLPARFAPVLFGFLVSGIMSCIVTCVATIKTAGLGGHTFGKWMGARAFSWPIAFAVILIVARLVSPKG